MPVFHYGKKKGRLLSRRIEVGKGGTGRRPLSFSEKKEKRGKKEGSFCYLLFSKWREELASLRIAASRPLSFFSAGAGEGRKREKNALFLYFLIERKEDQESFGGGKRGEERGASSSSSSFKRRKKKKEKKKGRRIKYRY